MKLIVGLGNPGPQYDKTRHNAGFMAVDRLHKRWAQGSIPKGRFQGLCTETVIKSVRCILLKPTTFMNLSGRSVAEAVGFYKLDPKLDLLVIVDDTALPCGAIRLRPSGSSGGHNGLADVERALSSIDYPRLRIGVNTKPPEMLQHDYVLGRFTPEQTTLLEPALEKSADAAELFIEKGLDAAMNKFNTAVPKPETKPEI